MARPQKESAEQKSRQVMIRLTQEQYDRIKEAAERQMRSMADYMRAVVLTAIQK